MIPQNQSISGQEGQGELDFSCPASVPTAHLKGMQEPCWTQKPGARAVKVNQAALPLAEATEMLCAPSASQKLPFPVATAA